MIYRLADLLLSGAVMNISLQPHESHIPFVLQVLIYYCVLWIGTRVCLQNFNIKNMSYNTSNFWMVDMQILETKKILTFTVAAVLLYFVSVYDWLQFVWNELHTCIWSEIQSQQWR